MGCCVAQHGWLMVGVLLEVPGACARAAKQRDRLGHTPLDVARRVSRRGRPSGDLPGLCRAPLLRMNCSRPVRVFATWLLLTQLLNEVGPMSCTPHWSSMRQ